MHTRVYYKQYLGWLMNPTEIFKFYFFCQRSRLSLSVLTHQCGYCKVFKMVDEFINIYELHLSAINQTAVDSIMPTHSVVPRVGRASTVVMDIKWSRILNTLFYFTGRLIDFAFKYCSLRASSIFALFKRRRIALGPHVRMRCVYVSISLLQNRINLQSIFP